MQLVNICMECAYEWEENKPVCCKHCGSGNIETKKEYDYKDLTIEDVLSLFEQGFAGECNADSKVVYFMEDK